MGVYLTAIAALLVVRGGLDWRRLLDRVMPGDAASTTLSIAGRDLAPSLLDRIVGQYRVDYPDLDVRILGGGTNQALEDLVNDRTDVALLYRRPTAREQDLFRETDGDTAIVEPIGVAGIVILANAASPAAPISLDDLVAIIRGGTPADVSRMYVPDPNQGLWDAFLDRLGLESAAADGVVFLADEAAVIEAVGNDVRALGLASAFTTDDNPSALGLRATRLAGPDGGDPAAPTYENVADGTYPLYHYLYVACRTHGGIQGAKFLTHISGDRGQRQIERAGFLPSRQVLREVILTRSPVGD